MAGWLVALLYLVASVVWVVLLNVALVAILLGVLVAQGKDPSSVAMDSGLLRSPLVLGATAVLQTVGMFGAMLGTGYLLGRRPLDELGLRGGRVAPFVAAGVVGLTAGLFAGWVSELLPRLMPFLESTIFEIFEEAMLSGPLSGRLVFYFAIVVAAPIFEELIFRGLLWDSLEGSIGPVATLLVTSVLFAGYHMVPIHVLSVFSTGLLIGWLRLCSGSVLPCILAHFFNNALSLAAVLLLAEGDAEWVITWPQAWGALALSLLAAAAAWRWGRRSDSGPLLVRSEASGDAGS